MAGNGRATPRKRRSAKKQVEDRVLAVWGEGIEEVAAAVLAQAKGGDVRSQQEVMQRVLGKAERREREDEAGEATLRIIIEDGGAEESAP